MLFRKFKLYSIFSHLALFFLLNISFFNKEEKAHIKTSIQLLIKDKSEKEQNNPAKIDQNKISEKKKIIKEKGFSTNENSIIKKSNTAKTLVNSNTTKEKKEIDNENDYDSSKKVKALDKMSNKISKSENSDFYFDAPKSIQTLEKGEIKDLGSKNNKENEIKNIRLANYEKYLLSLIEEKVGEKYPRRALKNMEEGRVEVILTIDKNGELIFLEIGQNSNAPRTLKNAARRLIKKLSPYKKEEFLKNGVPFPITIVYKLK